MFLAAARRRAVGGAPAQTKVLAEILSTLKRNELDLDAVRNGYQRLNRIEQTDFVKHIKALMEAVFSDWRRNTSNRSGFELESNKRLYDQIEKHLHTNLGDVWKRDPSTELIRELVDHPINFNEMENLRNRVNELAISQLQQPSKAPVGRFAVKISRLLRQAITLYDEAVPLSIDERVNAAKQISKIRKDINEAAEKFVQTHLRGGTRGGRRNEIGIRQQRLNSLQREYQQRPLDDQPVDTAEFRHLQRQLDGLGPTPTPFQLNQWDERFNRFREEVQATHVLLSLS